MKNFNNIYRFYSIDSIRCIQCIAYNDIRRSIDEKAFPAVLLTDSFLKKGVIMTITSII